MSQCGRDIGVLGKPQDVDGGIAEGGQRVAGVGTSDAIGILAEDGITNPVQAVFDVPVVSPPGEQLVGGGLLGGGAGDGVGRLDRFDAAMDDASCQAANPLVAGPIESTRQPRSDLQAVTAESPMPLGGEVRDLAERFTLPLRVGGKSPPGIRQ